jgi:hypothetical protein
MKLPRVRFTVRRLMVAVAVVALAIYGTILWRWSTEFRRLALGAEYQERIYGEHYEILNAFLGEAGGITRYSEGEPPPAVLNLDASMLSEEEKTPLRPEIAIKAARMLRITRHYEQLKFKYRHAARYPWLPVPPDPPEPE